MSGYASLFVRMAASIKPVEEENPEGKYRPELYRLMECPDCKRMVPFVRRIGYYECPDCQRRIYNVNAPTAADEG